MVRVERIIYGPSEKSVMNVHADGVLVFMTDHHVKLTYSDGTTSESRAKAGQTLWQTDLKHLPENLGDRPLELILIKHKLRQQITS